MLAGHAIQRKPPVQLGSGCNRTLSWFPERSAKPPALGDSRCRCLPGHRLRFLTESPDPQTQRAFNDTEPLETLGCHSR